MTEKSDLYYLVDANDTELGTFTTFEEAINNWEEGYLIRDLDGIAIYPEIKEDILITLAKGDKGNKVKAVQLLLIGYGFELQPFGADGNFSSLMEEKVKEFQESVNLEPTGVVDIITWNKMLGG